MLAERGHRAPHSRAQDAVALAPLRRCSRAMAGVDGFRIAGMTRCAAINGGMLLLGHVRRDASLSHGPNEPLLVVVLVRPDRQSSLARSSIEHGDGRIYFGCAGGSCDFGIHDQGMAVVSQYLADVAQA